MDLHRLTRRGEDLRAVDRVGAAIAAPVRRVLRQRPGLSRALRGEWLGHPVHPIAVTVPIGAWVSAAVLDLTPGTRPAARRLVGFGLLTTPLAVVLGAQGAGMHRWQPPESAEVVERQSV